MKTLLSIISIFLFVACNDSSKVDKIQLPPESSKTFTVKLVDSLGNVTVTLPSRYDTSFSWTHYSDCGKPCNRIKYRFQPMSLRISKEDGWIWLGEPTDSIERFTISHTGYFPFHDNTDSSFMVLYHKHKKESISNDPSMFKIKSDTLEQIGDRYFSILVFDNYDTIKSQFAKKILATTTIKSNTIDFSFELLTKRNDSLLTNFINNSKFYLETVRISNGK